MEALPLSSRVTRLTVRIAGNPSHAPSPDREIRDSGHTRLTDHVISISERAIAAPNPSAAAAAELLVQTHSLHHVTRLALEIQANN